MLPPFHSQTCREFKLNLEELKDVLSQDTVDRSHLKSSVAKLQDFFQNQILTLDLDELEPVLAQQVQSVQIEIDKQLKLLSLDALFFQAAKQPSTAQHRAKQASDRLTLLVRYCDFLLDDQ